MDILIKGLDGNDEKTIRLIQLLQFNQIDWEICSIAILPLELTEEMKQELEKKLIEMSGYAKCYYI